MITDKAMEEARAILDAEKYDQGFTLKALAERVERTRTEALKEAAEEKQRLADAGRGLLNVIDALSGNYNMTGKDARDAIEHARSILSNTTPAEETK